MTGDDIEPLRVDTDFEDDDPHDPHPTVSPATPAESFFISHQLRTDKVSAFALAAQLHSSKGGTTCATDDFQTACDDEGDMQDPRQVMTRESLFGKDILVLSRSVILESDEDIFEESMSTPTPKTATATATATQEEEEFNAAQVVYVKAKDIWSWGKGLPLVGFFEGITESVVTKVVSIAGTSLADIDGHVNNAVTGLDTTYLNPAIHAIVEAIMNGLGKADETFRPVIEAVVPAVLGPLGLIEPDKKKNDSSPELTTTPVIEVN